MLKDLSTASAETPRAGSPIEGGVVLSDWGVITATGPDAATFLHGQLTQDVAHLAPGQARLAGYCSAKGRLLATFIMWRRGPEEVALACSADLLPATLKRLSMFVLRAKCRLADASGTLRVMGLAGPAVQRLAGDAAAPWSSTDVAGGGHCLRLSDGAGVSRALLVLPAEVPPPALPPLPEAQWAWLEVASGLARVVAANADQFVPQMLNLELTGGVNFQKGCYPGQEVVARSQYRGTLKRRMFRAATPAPLAPGAEVFHESDPEQPAGRVVLCAPAPSGGHEVLVELKTAVAATPGRLYSGEVPLSLRTLPYAVPAEAG